MIGKVGLLFKAYRYHLSIFFILPVFFLGQPWSASAEVENSMAIDLSKKHSFLSFQDLYSDGQDNFLCVEVAPSQYSLWNPASDTLSSTRSGRCLIGPNLHLLNPSILLEDSSSNNSTKEKQTEANIYLKFENPTNHCGSNIRNYYRLETASTFEFYVIAKLKNVETYSSDSWCDGAGGKKKIVRQTFDAPRDIESVRLNKQWLLLYSYDKRFLNPIFIKININLSTYWSSEDNLFLVPKITVDEIWKSTPRDIIGRYNGVLSAIGKK